MDRNVTDFAALKEMSLADFSARSVLLRGVLDDTFTSIKEWCEATYAPGALPNLTGHETQHGKWTVRASFSGEHAVKNAAMFRMFWG